MRVRLLDANDPAGPAYHWAPYRWRHLSPARGGWSGVLAAPPLHGIYELQLQIQGRKQPLGAQRGAFITIFRDGYHGRWRLLEATTSPPG